MGFKRDSLFTCSLYVFMLTAGWPKTFGWHDLDNSEFDCWPLQQPNESNMIDCGGMEMAWLIRPPKRIVSQVEFNVMYSLTVKESFYEWAVENNILRFRTKEEAKKFCEEGQCPKLFSNANAENCCVHHANIHSCPTTFMVDGSICGPWIPDDGKIFTHTISIIGLMSRQNWTAKVVLTHTGVTSLIAHVRVGHMQAALEAQTLVLAATVCGDDTCQDDEDCKTCPADCGSCPMSLGTRAAIGVSISLVCAAFFLTVMFFEYQKQKVLWDESWIVSFKSLSNDGELNDSESSLTTELKQNVLDKSSSNEATYLALGPMDRTNHQNFVSTAIINGRMVAVKWIKQRNFTLTKTIREEVKQVREMEHPNLCRFIGGVVEPPHIAVLSEFCPKGSLHDVLLNEDIPLNWGFRFSFATDVARGMAFLHQHHLIHGHLKSTNCVIDDRWACKVTDYGLKMYKKEDVVEYVSTYQQQLEKIYLPPEMLMNEHAEAVPATDVYSYGVILVEIATRMDAIPIGLDIERTDVCWRPPLPDLCAGKAENDCPNPGEYIELIRKCWTSYAVHRPSFEQVKKLLYNINPNKESPVDMMMNLMEKYSKHLEAVVAERTQDLVFEKQKTDQLLYSMLPKQIADDLRQGRTTKAQSYSSTTIFFSDIVGFTQLSSSSTPYEVVTFLNKLYTIFDNIIDNYDVYKVETIGDAYMVVSGVPKENGRRHASEIADMALDLIAVTQSFVIPHRPQTMLQIRVGIHSGSVVAGVVGTKMPRYCLFGDAVNTTSRMESTSEGLRIQCSPSTSEILQDLGGYKLTCRGSIAVKGKGEMVTWWLDGRL